MGLTGEQIAKVLPIWDGVNCAAARQEVSRLIEVKRAEIHERIRELERFAEQLDDVRTAIEDFEKRLPKSESPSNDGSPRTAACRIVPPAVRE